jgi:photosystem II stability/assembly factor-like uncharacterized protein
MKNSFLKSTFITVWIVLAAFLSHCERDNYQINFNELYGDWTLRNVSGGWSGGSIAPTFDILSIDQRMRFAVYRNDTLLSRGRIEVVSQNEYDMTVDFKSVDNIFGEGIFNTIKIVRLTHDTLSLSDNCSDCNSYFFVKSDVFEDIKYKQDSNTLDFLEVNNYPIGTDQYLNSVYFQSENLGFITSWQGSIFKTSDGGKNWKIVESSNKLPLNAIAFINENTGFAVGGLNSCGGTGCVVPGYLMLRTDDAGETWSKVNLPYKKAEFSSIQFTASGFGMATGHGVRLRTLDGGQTWSDISGDKFAINNYLDILNDRVIYLSARNGQLNKSTDGGETWSDIGFNSRYYIKAVHFTDENTGYISFWGSLMKTTDGGNTWNKMEDAPLGINTMNFTSESDAVVFGVRTYASSKWDVWDSYFNIMINGKWFGDVRVGSHVNPYCLDSKHFYTITNDNKVSVIKLNN